MDGEERAQRRGGLAASLHSQCPQHSPGVPCGHHGSLSYPTLLTCRHAWPFPGQLCRRNLVGTCLGATLPGTHGTQGSQTHGFPWWDTSHPIKTTLTQPRRQDRCPPPAAGEGRVHTSAADRLSLLVDQEQDEGQAEDAHDAGARCQCGGRDICNIRGQSWSRVAAGRLRLAFPQFPPATHPTHGATPALPHTVGVWSIPHGIHAGMLCRLRR